jgi:hypothetical protein
MWYKQTAGSTKRKLLPKALKQAFANKQIVCVEYDYLTGDQEREIFQVTQILLFILESLLTEPKQKTAGPAWYALDSSRFITFFSTLLDSLV